MTTVVNAAVAVAKLFQTTPDLTAQAIVDSIFSNRSITSNLINAQVNGFNKNVRDFYAYAQDNWTPGIPSGAITDAFEDEKEDEVKTILEGIEGESIVIDEFDFNTPILKYLIYNFFQNDSNYSVERHSKTIWLITNLTTGQMGYPWVGTSYYDYQGGQYEGARLNGSTLEIPIRPTTQYPEYHVRIDTDVSPITLSTLLYQVRYHLLSDDGLPEEEQPTKWWVYNPADNTYPELNLTPSSISHNSFFPILPIRMDNQNVNEIVFNDPNFGYLSEEVEGLLRKLKIDLNELTANLVDPNNSTNIDDIDDVYLLFGINLSTDTQIGKNYLYESFRQLYYDGGNNQQAYWDWYDDTDPGKWASPPRKSLLIRNPNLDTAFEMGGTIFRYNFISVKERTGIVGNPLPGPDLRDIAPTTPELDILNVGDEENITIDVVIGTDNYYSDGRPSWNDHYLIIRKQYTGSTYIELVVHGIEHYFRPHSNKSIQHNLNNQTNDFGLFLPVSKDIVEKFSGINQSEIYYEALQLMVYAIQETYLEWYEDPDFLENLGIFILFVSILFGLEDLGGLIAEGLAVSEIATTVLMNLVFDFAAKELFLLLVETIGADNALILAAVALIAGLSTGEDELFLDLLDAEQLMQSATLMIESTNEVIEEDFLELMAEVEEYTEEAEQIQEELDAAQQLLDNGINVPLYAIIANQPYIDFNESVNGFLNRTIHNTNPGVDTLDMVHNYVDLALTLPKPKMA